MAKKDDFRDGFISLSPIWGFFFVLLTTIAGREILDLLGLQAIHNQ